MNKPIEPRKKERSFHMDRSFPIFISGKVAGQISRGCVKETLKKEANRSRPQRFAQAFPTSPAIDLDLCCDLHPSVVITNLIMGPRSGVQLGIRLAKGFRIAGCS